MRKATILFILIISIFSAELYAQLSVSIFSEYQLGNLPSFRPSNLTTLYNQVNLEHRQDNTTIGLRYEEFQSGLEERSYKHFSQRFVEWQKGAVKVRVGNFYSTLGRGLVMRAYELPNVVFEQRQFRRRYGYYRDIDGVLFEGTWKKFEIVAFRGSPLNNAFPPQLHNFSRRAGIVEGGQIVLRPKNWLMFGDAYSRITTSLKPQTEYNSIFSQISLNQVLRRAGVKRGSLKLYAEHARANSQIDNFFSTAKEKPHATYLALNFSANRVGLSAEYKDYRNFENGINLPPIGVMEHGYYLLNRSTHELLSNYEKGYQLEMTIRPTDDIFLLANTSIATNSLPFDEFTFAEKFLDATFYITTELTAKAFYDWSKDEIKSEKNRNTGGVNLEWAFWRQYGLTVDLQHQSVERAFSSTLQEKFKNTYLALAVSKSPLFSIGMAYDRSTDPVETDRPETPELYETKSKSWVSGVASFQLNMSHEISLFYGSRRGGLVCLSGTCFEVLPFEGMEIRWIGHF